MAILDPANLPTKPYKGGRSKIALGGGVASLLLAVAYALAAVLLDDRVRDVSDLKQLGLRIPLGVLPRIPSTARGRRG
jgi:capsular polysaccharide biosynthesis protein